MAVAGAGAHGERLFSYKSYFYPPGGIMGDVKVRKIIRDAGDNIVGHILQSNAMSKRVWYVPVGEAEGNHEDATDADVVDEIDETEATDLMNSAVARAKKTPEDLVSIIQGGGNPAHPGTGRKRLKKKTRKPKKSKKSRKPKKSRKSKKSKKSKRSRK